MNGDPDAGLVAGSGGEDGDVCSAGVVRCTGNCKLATELKTVSGLCDGYPTVHLQHVG
jgi:hypothetical protein